MEGNTSVYNYGRGFFELQPNNLNCKRDNEAEGGNAGECIKLFRCLIKNKTNKNTVQKHIKKLSPGLVEGDMTSTLL